VLDFATALVQEALVLLADLVLAFFSRLGAGGAVPLRFLDRPGGISSAGLSSRSLLLPGLAFFFYRGSGFIDAEFLARSSLGGKALVVGVDARTAAS